MQNRAMANRHTFLHNQSLVWGLCVGHNIILNVAVLSNLNRSKIRSQYSSKPNARVLPYLHISYQNRIRCNKRAGGNARRASLEFDNDWHVENCRLLPLVGLSAGKVGFCVAVKYFFQCGLG